MITRFFKKKIPSPAPKAVKADKPKAKTAHQKVLTAEGWKRMMLREKNKKN